MEIDTGCNLKNVENWLSVWNTVACQIYGEECGVVAVAAVAVAIATSESNRK